MSTLPLRERQLPLLTPPPLVGRSFRWLKERPIGWEAIILYTAIAVLFGRHTIAHMATGCSCSQMPDSWEVPWPFAWFPYALLHGLNPWYTHEMWGPGGFNIAGATGFPLVAMVLSPVTWAWGPLVSATVANLGAPVVTGWATYHLCRYVSKDRLAALVGGATVGFGTLVILQMWAAHIVVTIVVAPQFAVLAALRYFDGKIGRRRVIVELTICFVAQLFTDSEIFFSMSLFGGVLLVLGYALGTGALRSGIRSFVLPLIAAYAVTLLLSADYVYWLLEAPKYAVGIGNSWPTDILSYVVPTTTTWIGGRQFASVYALFDGGAESDAYLGLPLLLIMGRWISTHWWQRRSKFLAAATAISVLWVLGPTLHIAGKSTIWMPYRLFVGLPLMNEVLESRIAIYTELLAAVTLTLWLADRRKRQGRRWKPLLKWVAALTAAVFVVPNLVNASAGYTTSRPIPTFFATDLYRSYIERGATVFTLPWAFSSPSLTWQADDDMYYRLAGGYFTIDLPPGWQATPTIYDLWYNTPQHGDGPALRKILIEHGVDDVVVTPDAEAVWKATLRAARLGRPLYVGGVYLYKGPVQ